MAVDNTADFKESPSGWVAGSSGTSGLGLEEVGQVEGPDIDGAREDDEEREQDTGGKNNERDQSNDGA